MEVWRVWCTFVYGVKKVYFCTYKIAYRTIFYSQKFLAVPRNKKTRNSFFMQKKNHIIRYEIRLTEEEKQQFELKAQGFHSMSAMIRTAVAQLDDQATKCKIEWLQEFSTQLRHNDMLLSHITGNLNQVVKRANELAVASSLPFSFFEIQLYPEIVKVHKAILDLKQLQKKTFSQLLKMS